MAQNYPGSDFERSFNRSFRYKPSLGLDLREFGNISWFWPIMLFCFATPLGIGLGVVKFIANRQIQEAAAQRNAAWQQAINGSSYGYEHTAVPGGRAAEAIRKAKQNSTSGSAHQAQNTDGSIKGSKLPVVLLVLGAILLLAGVTEGADALSWLIYSGLTRWGVMDFLSDVAIAASGAASMLVGHKLRKRLRLWKRAKTMVGSKDHASLSDIGSALALSSRDTHKMLESAIDHNVFGPNAYVDLSTDTLVVRGEGPRKAPAPKPETKAEAKKEESHYQAVLRQLREVNQAIPGEEMTAKIDRLEHVTTRIFEVAESQPEKLPQMRRFMDYYLPTSLKLLQQYAEFDRQGVEGEIISDSKRKIEQTMDTLVTGFEQQLDKLFASDAMDVSTDIDVLTQMMEQDGLRESAAPFGDL